MQLYYRFIIIILKSFIFVFYFIKFLIPFIAKFNSLIHVFMFHLENYKFLIIYNKDIPLFLTIFMY